MKTLSLATGALALLLSASVAMAAPCNTGAAKSETTNQKSSDLDGSTKNEAGGKQPSSPGTVGAMNNVGANQGVGQPAPAKAEKGGAAENKDPGAKNLAGGEQPASPATVGAMNATGSQQNLGKDDDC